MSHILIIDDDPGVRSLATAVLHKAGFKTSEANNADDGLIVFRATRPDLVITDILMPDKDGYEFLVELRREFPTARIIAMSGMISRTQALRVAGLLGARTVIPKPFANHELLEAVQEALGEAGKAESGNLEN